MFAFNAISFTTLLILELRLGDTKADSEYQRALREPAVYTMLVFSVVGALLNGMWLLLYALFQNARGSIQVVCREGESCNCLHWEVGLIDPGFFHG